MIDATKKIRVDRTLNTSNINDYSARYILSASYGSAGYNSGTGVFSIPKYTSQLDNDSGFITEGYYTPGPGIQIGAGGSISSTIPSYSDELARLAISAGVGISYDSTTGVISATGGGGGGTSNFSGSYLDLTNRPSLSTVATTGSYLDLTNKPTLFSGSYTDLTNKPTLFSGSYTDLTNKPTLFSGSYNDLINKPTIPTNTSELMNGAGFVTSSALSGYATETFVNSAVSNLVASAPAVLDTLNELATALGNDANYSTTISTALGNRLRVDVNTQGLTTTQKSNAATNLGLATVATSGSYNDLSNKPTIPTSNNQLTNDAGYITSSAITGKQDTLVSGVSIKTINGISILGNGNISVTGSSGVSLPNQTGNAGKHLTTDGSNLSWVTPTTGSTGFDFGNFTGAFTDPISYLLDKVGMDFGTFTQPTELSVDLGIV